MKIQIKTAGRAFWHLVVKESGKIIGFACTYETAKRKAKTLEAGVAK